MSTTELHYKSRRDKGYCTIGKHIACNVRRAFGYSYTSFGICDCFYKLQIPAYEKIYNRFLGH